jgi:hypothetical protein
MDLYIRFPIRLPRAVLSPHKTQSHSVLLLSEYGAVVELNGAPLLRTGADSKSAVTLKSTDGSL